MIKKAEHGWNSSNNCIIFDGNQGVGEVPTWKKGRKRVNFES